jgi:predicted 3-demethylubiquinone-9 3-methyltransferase (glyoxalase superfamily)
MRGGLLPRAAIHLAMPAITTFLGFDDRAEEAAAFYTAIFPNSRIIETTRFPAAAGEKAGKVMMVSFELDGQQYFALNGGPPFTFSMGISLMINCETQAEVDHYWSRLGAGGQEHACGWLSDKFGVYWQVTPTVLMDLMSDPATVERAFAAMIEMVKIDIAALKKACGLA